MDVLPRQSMIARAPLMALLAGLCAAFSGCALILGLDPLSITDWRPHDARIDVAAISEIWVEFSSNVDHVKAEQAFTLSENAAPEPGRFTWNGNRLSFSPARPVSAGNDYEIAVLSTAETTGGNSLSKDFRFAFSTKGESGKPTIVATQPVDGSRVTNPLLPVTVTFSEPMDSVSFIAAFSVSPDPGGTITFDTAGSTASFTPLSEWKPGTEYSVVLSDSVKDRSGNHLAAALRLRFTAGAEAVLPTLLAVRPTVNGAAQGTGLVQENPADGALQINPAFEASWGIELQFSEPVARENLESFIDFQPAWSYQVDPAGAPRDRFTLVPKERFVWGALYNLAVKRGVLDRSGNASADDALFFIRADGPTTKPPQVGRIRFRTNPDDSPSSAVYGEYEKQDAFTNLDLSRFVPGVDTVSYFDVYLSLANGAAVDPFSLMRSFSVTATNGAALITPIAVDVTSFADPQPIGVPGLTPARVSVRVTSTTNSGVVTLGLSESLTDTAGNKATAAFSLPLLK